VQPSSALTIAAVDNRQDPPHLRLGNRVAARIGSSETSSATHNILRARGYLATARTTFLAANRRNRRLGQTTDLLYILYSIIRHSFGKGP
jgi:hypothetical protein